MAVIVPGVTWRPDPISSRPVAHRWIILHTIVGRQVSNNYHINILGDGEAVQVQDLLLRSAASVEANPYSIAISAVDMGPEFPPWSGSDVPRYNPAQAETLIYVLSWICRRFAIPVTNILTSHYGTDGIGWHRLGINGNFPPDFPLYGRQSGGQRWSNSTGKACPGDNKIHQILNEIIPALRVPEIEMPKPSDVTSFVRFPALEGATVCGLKGEKIGKDFLVSPTSTNQQGRASVSYAFEASGGVWVDPSTYFKGSVWDHVPGGLLGPNAPKDEWVVAGAVLPNLSGYTLISNKGGEFNFGTTFTNGRIKATAGSDKIQSAYFDDNSRLWLVCGEGTGLTRRRVR